MRQDATDAHATEAAKEEAEILQFLNILSPAVVEPIHFSPKYSCLVLIRLRGHDLLSYLRDGSIDRSEIQTALEKGIQICGNWHTDIGAIKHTQAQAIETYDYSTNPYVKLTADQLSIIRDSRFGLVVSGYEVRNLKLSSLDRGLRFFDPHRVHMGMAEQDIARYFLSILSVRWGRNANCAIWTNCDYHRLIDAYEDSSGQPVDRAALKVGFDLEMAIRQLWAIRHARLLKPVLRLAARAYMKLFWHQIGRWRVSHDI